MILLKSENKNFLYNVGYQLLSLIVPLIMVPYTSRVLGVENIGIYAYTYSIVYVFMLIGMLGINNYGSREIASVRDNRELLSRKFCEIYELQIIVNLVVIFFYFIYICFFCKEYKIIALIQAIFLISNIFDINWFYFGIENFKLTVSRNFLIKVISIFLVFSLIKREEDIVVYTLVMSVTTLICQIYLLVWIHKYVDFSLVPMRESFLHFKEIIILFIPVLAFAVYRVMDKTMIGKFSSVSELAYYENAEKLMNVPLAVISALGTVMLPRMSYLFENNKFEYETTIQSSMKLMIKMSVIMCLGLVLIADDVVLVMFGEVYSRSGSVLKLLSVTILASSWANVIRTQYLIPLKKNSIYITSTIGAAIANILFNSILISKFGAIGACIGTIVAEYFISIYQCVKTKKELKYREYLKMVIRELCIVFSIIIAIYFITLNLKNVVLRLIMKITMTLIVYMLINRKYITKMIIGK